MTLVNSDTGEVIAQSTPDEARQRADRIKVGVEAVWQLIVEAYQRRDWVALGYASWDDYTTREFGTSRIKLPREERQEVVQSLRDAGLSTRAIAAATGVNRETVMKDLKVVGNQPPAPDPRAALDRAREALVRSRRPQADPEPKQGAEVAAPVESERPARVTGTDGKTYSAASRSKPRRAPLSDAAQKAGWEFRKATERLQRICDDDRFPANKKQVATHLRGHLLFAQEVCQDLIDLLGE